VQRLINTCAGKGEMLARSLAELYDNMRDYYVFEEAGEVAGTCALHICWEDLAEIRSLCVVEGLRNRGIGRALVERCMEEARDLTLDRLFVLTYQNVFFAKLGFTETEKGALPHKIWTDCIKCPKFPQCDEVAMVAGLKDG